MSKVGVCICFWISSFLCLAYADQPDGYLDLSDGTRVEGSLEFGGIQPDYIINLQAKEMASILKRAKEIGEGSRFFWDKVQAIVELIRNEAFQYRDYKNPFYRRLLKDYRDRAKPIPLHEYLKVGAGVCREYAMLLHLALKEAGIENSYVSAEIFLAGNAYYYSVTEDHSFVVLKYRGVNWVVDAYSRKFNGFRLRDLQSSEGVGRHSIHAPIGKATPGRRRILRINEFPRIWLATERSCKEGLSRLN